MNLHKIAKDKLQKIKALSPSFFSSNSAFSSSFNYEKLTKQLEDIEINSHVSTLLYSMKNMGSIKGEIITGGSKYLENYTSPYSCTVFNSLKEAGALNVCNANLDEFAMSGTGLDSHYGFIPNPLNEKHIIGGSSSGSAYIVAKKIVDFSISSDTGDSTRVPAANSNIYGYKPTYGLVSRYGFFPFCSQLDTVSIMANDIKTIASVLSVIAHKDTKDLTTINSEKKDYLKNLNAEIKQTIKIGIIEETFWSNSSPSEDFFTIKKEFFQLKKRLEKDKNITVETVSFDSELLRLSILIYMIVAYSESVSSYLNINGLIFPFNKDEDGKFTPDNLNKGTNYTEILEQSRSKFGKEFIFRQALGAYFLNGKNYEEIYIQSKKILSLINEKVEKLLSKFDLIISPTQAQTPTLISTYKKTYSNDNIESIVLLCNFCGLPAISIPWIFISDLPIGLHVFSKYKNDEFLLQATNYLKAQKLV